MEGQRKRLFEYWKGICICLSVILLLFLQAAGTAKAAGRKSDTQKKVIVKLYQLSGQSLYKKITVKKGYEFYLPGMRNKKGKTMLGWSEQRGSQKAPQYQVGQKITVRRSMKLYPVLFKRSNEPSLRKGELASARAAAVGPQGCFSRIIFVGDSRTTGLQDALRKEFGSSVTKNVYFVCKFGSGLSWLKSSGEQKLMQLAKKNTAVIFNHGVNDLKKANEYISYMKQVGVKLRKRGCTLYYMSVNPFNKLEITAFGLHKRKEDEHHIIQFNRQIRTALCRKGFYHYLDSYSYLLQNGYGTREVKHRDDGIHYTAKTYKRIYEFCLRKLSQYQS